MAFVILCGRLLLAVFATFTRYLEVSRNLLGLGLLSWRALIWRVDYARLLGSNDHGLFVADALVTLVANENSISRIRVVVVSVVASTNIVWIVVRVARPIFLANPIIVPKGRRS